MKTSGWLGAAALFVAGCPGDETPMTTADDTSSTGMATTAPGTSTGVEPMGSTSGETSDGATTVEPGTTTSGAADSSTGAGIMCGNDVVEGDEVCDGTDLVGEDCVSQGFESGSLGCLADCTGYDTSGCVTMPSCGDGMIGGTEVCDGVDLGGASCASEGFDNGQLACAETCDMLDVSGCGTCGNVIVDGDEVCDDIVLLGQTCLTQGFDNGTLGCAPDCLTYDTSGCGTCGNDIIDGTEEICDNLDNGGETCLTLGFDSGTLGACMPDCLDFDTAGCGTCGNGTIDGDELCDGMDLPPGETCITQGFDNGTLGCDAGCGALDTAGCGICGNGIVDGSESCDGMNLGGETCASLGLMGGTLGCSASCQFDFSSCDIPGTPFGSDSGYNGFFLFPPMLPCDDISATGVATGLGDDAYTPAPLGFTFPMYGVPFTDTFISSNGAVYFGTDANITLGNVCMPGSTFNVDDNIMAVYWDDLNPSAAGDVYYQTLGVAPNRRFVVQWDVPHFGGNNVDLIRVQVMFQENGSIEVCYPDTINAGNIDEQGAGATAGIQLNPMDGFQYSCDAPNLVDGLQLLYLPI